MLLFCLTLQGAFDADQQQNLDVRFIASLDDEFLHGQLGHMQRAFQAVQTLTGPAGLEMSLDKCWPYSHSFALKSLRPWASFKRWMASRPMECRPAMMPLWVPLSTAQKAGNLTSDLVPLPLPPQDKFVILHSSPPQRMANLPQLVPWTLLEANVG
jgi:hypothetical protein